MSSLKVVLAIITGLIPSLIFSQNITSPISKKQTHGDYSGNPIFDGWYADPEARIFDHQCWVYPTYSDKYEEQVFLDAFSSPDLVHWTKHVHILDTADVHWAKRAVWAPSIVNKRGKFYLFFAANDIQNDKQTGGIGIAISNSPSGPFVDYIGRPLIDAFHNGAQPIDQFVFLDNDGQYYMTYGGWHHCNIVKLSADFKSLSAFPDGSIYKEITPTGYVEGSFMFVRNGKYYFMWSEGNWTGPDYSVAYAISDSPTGPFERIGKILQEDATIATGAGHHSVIQIPGTDRWYIIYHRHPLGDTNGNHRVTCIDDLKFNDQGFIVPVKMTNDGIKKTKL